MSYLTNKRRAQKVMSTTVVGLEQAVRQIGFKEGDWVVMDAEPAFGRRLKHPLFVVDVIPCGAGKTLVVCQAPVDDRSRDECDLEPGNWFLLFDPAEEWRGFLRNPLTGEVRWCPVGVRPEGVRPEGVSAKPEKVKK